MEWIKKNPHQLALAVLSVGLIAASAAVLLSAQSFPEKFSSVQTNVTPNDKIPPLELGPVQDATKRLGEPTQWQPNPDTAGSLFVSTRYLIDNGKPMKPEQGSKNKDPLTQQDIPNKWFIDNKLNLFDPTVVMQDPDKDGFLNCDEWRNKTNPNDSKSHPAYYTKLFLKQFIRVPFRLLFQAYDLGDPKKKVPASFQINTLDLRQPSEFLEIGKKVARTNFQLENFAVKEAENPKTGEKTDVSELTLLNTETGDRVTLVLAKITDSPDSFADLDYTWTNPRMVFRVKKLGEFALKPNTQERYKLLDIKEEQAVIQLPSGEKFTVGRLSPAAVAAGL